MFCYENGFADYVLQSKKKKQQKSVQQIPPRLNALYLTVKPGVQPPTTDLDPAFTETSLVCCSVVRQWTLYEMYINVLPTYICVCAICISGDFGGKKKTIDALKLEDIVCHGLNNIFLETFLAYEQDVTLHSTSHDCSISKW